MKYRIIRLRNQEYEVQRKYKWFRAWKTISWPNSLDRAKELMNEIIADIQHEELKKQGRKIAEIIEEFEV